MILGELYEGSLGCVFCGRVSFMANERLGGLPEQLFSKKHADVLLRRKRPAAI